MSIWEEVQADLVEKNILSGVPKESSDPWEYAATQLSLSGNIPPTQSSWEQEKNNIPAFLEKAPVMEGGLFKGRGATGEWEEDGMIEKGWDVVKRISSFGGKAFWKGLGIITWPLERIEYTMATPLVGIAKEKPLRKLFVKGEGSAKEASDKIISDTLEALKTWIPGREVPENAKTFNDLYANYYEDLVGEPSPDWYSWTMGGITSFVTTPAIQSKILKVIAKPIKTPFIELTEQISPKWWKRAKLQRKAGFATRVEKTEEIGKTLSKKDLESVAKELSERTGTQITPEVVQKRLTQIVKGGITEQPELLEKVNPVISEFQNNLSQLKELNVKGMADKFLYTKKLTHRELSILRNKKDSLQKKLNHLIPGAVQYTDEQKQILMMGSEAPVNIYKGPSGQKYLGESDIIKNELGQLISKTTKELVTVDDELSEFASSVRKGKVLVTPYQKKLTQLAAKLKVSGKPSIEKDLLELGQQIEKGDLEYIDKLAKILNTDAKVLQSLKEKMIISLTKAGDNVYGISEEALKLRQAEGQKLVNKILSVASKEEIARISGINPLLKKIITTPKGMSQREYYNRESLLKLANKLKINNKEGVVDSLLKLGEAIDSGNLKYIERFSKAIGIQENKVSLLIEKAAEEFVKVESKIGKSAEPVLKLREREGRKIVDELLKIAAKTEKQKVEGLKPLLNKIFEMKYKFPGKSKVVDKLTSQIQEINNLMYTSEIFGGTEYFPRMYAVKEGKNVSLIKRKAKKLAIKAPYAKERMNIPFVIRKEMGEITTVEYPVVKRLIQQAADIETARLFNNVAENSKYSSRIANGYFKLIPKSDKYSRLSNMYVHPKIYSDIMEINRIKGNVESVYDEAISLWKLFKVSWSPGAHFRNKFGNSILKSLSGMSEQEKIKYGIQAWKHLRSNSNEYKNAKKFLKQTTFAGEELIKDVFKEAAKVHKEKSFFGRSYEKFRKIAEAPGKGYQALEFHDKFTLYLKARAEGKSVIEAVEYANKWLFDYSDLATWEKNIMRRVMPFYTFPRKALPRVVEAAINNPHTLYKYPLMAKLTTQYSLYKLNLTEKDYEKIKKIMPEYMKQGSYVLMPYRDANGDLRFFDWTYIIPWGEMTEVTDRGLTNVLVSNPLFTLISDINHNKSSFTGKEIWKETDTTEEKTWKSTEYIWQGLVPSLSYKGIYWDKLYRAATGQTRYGKKELIPETVAHTIFGLRTQALDMNIAQRKKIYDTQSKLRELQGKMIDVISKQSRKEINPIEAQKLKQQYLKQTQDLMEEMK